MRVRTFPLRKGREGVGRDNEGFAELNAAGPRDGGFTTIARLKPPPRDGRGRFTSAVSGVLGCKNLPVDCRSAQPGSV
jgi:hypothetical protein